MNTHSESKINQLLKAVPQGVVLQSFWLANEGYSLDLQKIYRRSHWLSSVGNGAMIRSGDAVGYEGAVHALQEQSKLHVHPAGRTALSMQGRAHYLSLSEKKITLFGEEDAKLPAWFKKHDWGVKVEYHHTSFLPPGIGMTEIAVKNFTINISGATRAMMECLYLAPGKMPLMECMELMEGLNNLPPAQVQGLLEACTSVKVKRLFMYLASKINHEWIKFLNPEKIDLGSGKRSLVNNGVFIDAYQITVPKELADYGQRSV